MFRETSGFRFLFFAVASLVLLTLISATRGVSEESPPVVPNDVYQTDATECAKMAVSSKMSGSTADHSQFAELKKEFQTGPEVTAACLTCHTEASKQIMKTSHWTWICPRAKEELAEKQGRVVGKGEHVINNFCIALGSNEPRCTSCHAGYGWKDNSFDFDDQTLVDCLVCHDTTATYKKYPTSAGHPVYASEYPDGKEWPKGSGNMWPPVDLTKIAQNVGKPSRHTCGSCHFFGGGGEGVKHGDMDVTLEAPERELDVHMHKVAADGKTPLCFQCTECHTTKQHKIAGRCFTIPAYEDREFVIKGLKREDINYLACEACHTQKPHTEKKINDHVDKVSCQACHIPTMARNRPTKMWWDWSKAGQKDTEGGLISKIDTVTSSVSDKTAEVLTYSSQKGEFIWALDEEPEYTWFNGNVSHTFLGDTIDDTTTGKEHGTRKGKFDNLDLSKPVLPINLLQGSYDDPRSRIWPVKIHRGLQPYDTKTKKLVVPKLFGAKGTGAYWADYNWEESIIKGMEYVGQEYSGEYGWIQTEMYWPLSHMVAPGEKALQCSECHSRNGRIAHLKGFYLPGRDRFKMLDILGWGLALLTAFGVVVHGSLRIILGNRKKTAADNVKE